MEDDEGSLIAGVSPESLLLHPYQCSQKTSRSCWFRAEKPWTITTLICLAIFLWVFSGMLSIVPATRLAEEIFCRRYYGPNMPIDETMCKVKEVQAQIAYVFGFSVTLTSLIGILVAFPFGVFADRARKPVYLLGALGQCLSVMWALVVFYFSESIPIELVLLAPISGLLGGGLTVATTVLCAIISDVNTPENKAVSFFFFSLSSLMSFI
ncbi:hypothetical protein F5Y06DRAFT_299133 [Hypoxylon sp. FL0890]|nr:hypothetical protein F5Y06DRAFT_299133 [Hypoxylon sp. FL0890]